MKRKRKYLCPTCRKEVSLQDKHFPFCSQRCRLMDLCDWLDGRFRVAGKETAGEVIPDEKP